MIVIDNEQEVPIASFTFIIPDLPDDRTVTELMVATLELHDEYLLMVSEYYADFTDESLGTTTNQLRKHTDMHIRSKVTGYQKHWYCTTKVWGVEINLMGVTYNLVLCFKRESQAQELCDALLKWLLK